MKTISLDFHLSWAESNLSPGEHNPEVRVYFDNRVIRDPVILKQEDMRKNVRASITGATTIHHDLPHDLRIGMAAFAWRPNDYGAPCLLDIGTSHIRVRHIYDQLKIHPEITFKLPVIMHTVENYIKGQLLFTVKRGDLRLDDGLDFEHEPVQASIAEVGDNIVSYIQNTIRIEEGMQDTIPGTSRIRVPYYMGEYGLELATKSPFPAVSFVLGEIPKTNTRYCVNALRNVLRRDGLELSDWNRLNTEGQARSAVLAVCNMIQVFDYVSDTIDKNTPDQPYDAHKVEAIENFGNGLVTGSLDCEDGGKGELTTHNAFITQKLDMSVDGAKTFRHVQRYLEAYVPILSLDAVRGAAVGDQEAHIGAHMNVNYIPTARFRQWLCKTREGRQLDRKLPYAKIASHIEEDQLPFMVAEGTGMYEPLGYENPYINAMAYVYQAPSLSPYRKPISHDKNATTSFFIGSITGLTDYFMRRGTNIGTFTYGTVQEDGTITRGAYYDDMINNPNKIALIPTGDALSPKMMQAIETAVSITVPPEPLVLQELDVDRIKNKNDELEFICSQKYGINELNADSLLVDVPVYVRSYQINRKLAQNIVSDFQRLENIVSVSYREEYYTDKQYGYCMTVKVKMSKSTDEK